MSRMISAAAEKLDPAQAADLVRLLDLQAEWQNLKDDGQDHTTARLQGLQRTFEAFRVGLAEYTARYRTAQVPEVTPTSPDRLGTWCGVVRAVVQRAAPEVGVTYPAQVVTRAYRMAERMARRLGTTPIVRTPGPATSEGVAADLEAVRVWCCELAPQLLPGDAVKSPSYETPEAR